jgi:hypothetical protein
MTPAEATRERCDFWGVDGDAGTDLVIAPSLSLFCLCSLEPFVRSLLLFGGFHLERSKGADEPAGLRRAAKRRSLGRYLADALVSPELLASNDFKLARIARHEPGDNQPTTRHPTTRHQRLMLNVWNGLT